jgi:hypothetical protein
MWVINPHTPQMDTPVFGPLSPSSLSSPKLPTRIALLAAGLLATVAIAGCGASPNAAIHTESAAAITGRIHGGQQPVAHATVTLYAPGTTNYGSAPVFIVSTTSDGLGNFTLPRPYACPTNSGNVYLLATGGDAGSGPNSSLALAALLGPCSNLTASTYVFISEATTVAAAYALAPFADLSTGATNIGTSSTNLLGLNNALGPANNLVNTTTGAARGVNELPGMVLPTNEINTLANILAACVNTNGATGATDPCGILRTAATPPGGTAPADTFQAAIDIALNPGNNAATLFGLSSALAPFQPTLGATPGDFAIGIQYTGGQIAGSQFTTGMAIDAQGNAWVGNGVGTTSGKSVSKISPAGIFLSPPNGFLPGTAGGNGYSIDASGNVFIGVAAQNAVYELNQSGNTVGTLAPSSLVKPNGIAVDNRTGGVWVANANNQPGDNNGNSDFEGTTVSYVTSAGADAPGSPYGANNGPLGVEIDGLGNIWVADSAANTTSNGSGFLARYAPPTTAGNPYTMQTVSTGAASYPFELAFDSANNVWVTEENSVGKFSNTGTQLSVPNYVSAATNYPTSIVIDGLGRAFVSNDTTPDESTPGSLTVFSPTGALISTANSMTGYLANNTIAYEPYAPTGLGIDASGNVWISGINNAPNGYGFVTELIGIAAPVVTPTSVASSTNKYGVRP